MRQKSGALDLVDGENKILGRVLNCMPVGYPEFADCVQRCYGDGFIPVELVRVESRSGKRHAMCEVKVVVDPRQEVPEHSV